MITTYLLRSSVTSQNVVNELLLVEKKRYHEQKLHCQVPVRHMADLNWHFMHCSASEPGLDEKFLLQAYAYMLLRSERVLASTLTTRLLNADTAKCGRYEPCLCL